MEVLMMTNNPMNHTEQKSTNLFYFRGYDYFYNGRFIL